MRYLRLALLMPLALLAACGSDELTDPSGITPGEAQELNEAAAMLDANAMEINVDDGDAPEGEE